MGEVTHIASRYEMPSVAVRGLIAALLAAAAGVSGFLLVRSLSGQAVPGCGPGSGCDAVLGSAWARVAGVPVSGLAVVVDGAVLLALWNAGVGATAARRRAAWAGVIVGSFVIIAAAAWFVVVQLALLRAVCPWCMAAHAAGAAAGVLALAVAPVGKVRLTEDEPPDPLMIAPRRAAVLAGAGVLAVALLAAVQTLAPGPQMRVLRFGGVVGRPTDVPVLGSIDAPHLVLNLYDYTCPHCRVMHGYQAELLRARGDAVAIVALPVPLDAACNSAVPQTEERHRGACELAKLALAVWRADPAAFAGFDGWLFGPPLPRTPEEARVEAARLVGDTALRRALADPWVTQQIEGNVTMYRATGAGPLPRLMSGESVLIGRARDAQELIATLDGALGLR